MPITSPRRRRTRRSAFTRQRYSNYFDWLVREAARLATSARGVRDILVLLGAEEVADVEAATDATPTDVGIVTTGAVTGSGATSISSGTVTDTGAAYATLGIADADLVELIYSGDDFPNGSERYLGVVSSLVETSFDVTPAPPDAAWGADTDVLITVVSAAGRD